MIRLFPDSKLSTKRYVYIITILYYICYVIKIADKKLKVELKTVYKRYRFLVQCSNTIWKILSRLMYISLLVLCSCRFLKLGFKVCKTYLCEALIFTCNNLYNFFSHLILRAVGGFTLFITCWSHFNNL